MKMKLPQKIKTNYMKLNLNIYIASNVGMDYFFFLQKILHNSECNVQAIYLISESDYRASAKSKGFKKIYLRLQMYILYPILLISKAIVSPRNSIFIVSSNTFYAPLLTKLSVFWKHTKVIHLLYDLYPDAIEVAGIIKQNGLLSKFIGTLSRNNFNLTDATVYLGDFLKLHAETRWTFPKRSFVIPISTDLTLYEKEFSPLPDTERIIIHYGGQIGHLHDASSLIECIKHVLASDLNNKVDFNFYVSGAQAKFLEESLYGYPVKIKPAVNSNEWRKDIKNFHIGLVTLTPGGATVCLPSKTYGMMAGGLSILAICPLWSDLANLILENNAGWVINNANSKVLNQVDLLSTKYLSEVCQIRKIDQIKSDFYIALKIIVENKNLIREKRKNAFENIRLKYSAEELGKKWLKVIE